MLKKWFTLPSPEEMDHPPVVARAGETERVSRPPGLSEEPAPTPRTPAAAANNSGVPKYGPFEQIYQAAAVKPPRLAYGILKVAEMMNSPHLSGMSPDARRCSLLMALEA